MNCRTRKESISQFRPVSSQRKVKLGREKDSVYKYCMGKCVSKNYVTMYVSVYVRTHILTYACMYVCMHACMYVCMWTSCSCV